MFNTIPDPSNVFHDKNRVTQKIYGGEWDKGLGEEGRKETGR